MAEITNSPAPVSAPAMTPGLSLAAKLYSIFALVAVLVAAITALSDYNTRQNAALTEAVATASRAAVNVERVNSLVYAVVMKSAASTCRRTSPHPATSRPPPRRCPAKSKSSSAISAPIRFTTSSGPEPDRREPHQSYFAYLPESCGVMSG